MAHQYIFVMKDLRKVYPPNREVLKGIWLSFFPGAKIGLIGANGRDGSAELPHGNPIPADSGGNYDAFVTKLDSSGGTLVYSSYLGGGNYDYARGIAVDSSGRAYVTGYTVSTNFPTAAPFQAEFRREL